MKLRQIVEENGKLQERKLEKKKKRPRLGEPCVGHERKKRGPWRKPSRTESWTGSGSLPPEQGHVPTPGS